VLGQQGHPGIDPNAQSGHELPFEKAPRVASIGREVATGIVDQQAGQIFRQIDRPDSVGNYDQGLEEGGLVQEIERADSISGYFEDNERLNPARLDIWVILLFNKSKTGDVWVS
jgi:hypothetical protein